MKTKLKRVYILPIFLIISTIKYISITKDFPNIIMFLLGSLYIFIYYILFSDLLKYVDINEKNKKYILCVVVFANLATALVNSSAYINDLVNYGIPMYVYIFSKIAYYISVLICFLNAKNIYVLSLCIILSILAFLSFLEFLQIIEVFLEIVILIIYSLMLFKNKKEK